MALCTLADTNDPNNPMVVGTLARRQHPIYYNPNPVTPSLGAGTSVSMQDITTSGAAPGIYALWVQGQAGSPYLTTKHEPLARQGRHGEPRLRRHSDVLIAGRHVGRPGDLRIAVKDAQNQAFGGSVALASKGSTARCRAA